MNEEKCKVKCVRQYFHDPYLVCVNKHIWKNKHAHYFPKGKFELETRVKRKNDLISNDGNLPTIVSK